MLLADPPLSYAEISARLNMPVDSIGPLRARCLKRLRKAYALPTEDGEKPSTATGPGGPES